MRLIILIVCMLLLLTACDKDVYTNPTTAELTCQNLEWHYNKCNRHNLISRVSNCREGYTIKILECYGSKK